MCGLIRIENLTGPLSFLNGSYARVLSFKYAEMRVKVQSLLDPMVLRKNLGVTKYFIDADNAIFLTDGANVVGNDAAEPLVWNYLNVREQVSLVNAFFRNPDNNFCEGFESYIRGPNNNEFLDAFIQYTIDLRVTHKRFGPITIMGNLRWSSEKIDGSQTFKINNNYAGSMSRIMRAMFSNLADSDFFEVRVMEGEDKLEVMS